MVEEKIHIGLDLTPLQTELRTGAAGRVAQAYFEWFTANPNFIVQPYSNGDFPRENGDGSEQWREKLFDRWRLAWNYTNTEIDVLQIIDPRRMPPRSAAPVVTLVHDLIPYLYRERYQESIFEQYIYWRMKRQILNSDVIVTPSRSTSKDLQMSFGLDSENIRPIYHGIDHRRFYPRSEEEVQTIREELGVDEPYFLMVADMSSYDPIKNLEEVVENWDYRVLSEVQLVVAGKQGEYSRRLEEKWEGKEDNLLFTGYVDDSQLASLYTGAQLFLFPSRYEGYGFSVLEAMACGTRPVVRDVGAMREISGEAAIQLDDNEYAEQLMDVVTDSIGDFSVEDDCVEQAKKFRWTQTVRELESLYGEISTVAAGS